MLLLLLLLIIIATTNAAAAVATMCLQTEMLALKTAAVCRTKCSCVWRLVLPPPLLLLQTNVHTQPLYYVTEACSSFSLSLFLIRSFGESLLSAAAAADFVAGGASAASPAGGTSVVRVLFSRYVTDCGRRMVVVVGIAHVDVPLYLCGNVCW